MGKSRGGEGRGREGRVKERRVGKGREGERWIRPPPLREPSGSATVKDVSKSAVTTTRSPLRSVFK